MTPGAAEAMRRNRKVVRLLGVIEELTTPVNADDVAAWPASTWELATEVVNAANPHDPQRPPSERTKALVVEAMQERARLSVMTDAEVFSGLGNA